jgi:hypothetical protein
MIRERDLGMRDVALKLDRIHGRVTEEDAIAPGRQASRQGKAAPSSAFVGLEEKKSRTDFGS